MGRTYAWVGAIVVEVEGFLIRATGRGIGYSLRKSRGGIRYFLL